MSSEKKFSEGKGLLLMASEKVKRGKGMSAFTLFPEYAQLLLNSKVYESDPHCPGVEFGSFVFFEHGVYRIGCKEVDKSPSDACGGIPFKRIQIIIVTLPCL
jgi:hypothetical protein